MNRFAIVVIGYNRVDSIQRLIKSLQNATYDENVDLIISIDNSGTDAVERYAQGIEWPYGKLIIKTFSKRMGLRKHVLTCGCYLNEFNYDAIIVLEDDLFVAPCFFSFAKQAVEKYGENDDVAGISLYLHSWNLNADRPFIPLYKGYDVFFMQYAQSWGQVWMKKQWNEFYNWYITKQYEKIDVSKVPDNILKWPESSWLKYHIQYCIDQNKFFVYPYMSLTTNFADAGTHYVFSTNKMQIPINMGKDVVFRFANEIKQTSIYDVYHENQQLYQVLGLEESELEVDLFGLKKSISPGCNYILSTKSLKYKVVKSFGLQMRPWELNIIYEVPGNEIILYDTRELSSAPKMKHMSLIHWVYDTRGEVLLKRNFLDIMLHEIYNKLRKK